MNYHQDPTCLYMKTEADTNNSTYNPELTPVSSTNKTDRHDRTPILLKVVLNTKTLTQS